jgi:hypothetical protein
MGALAEGNANCDMAADADTLGITAFAIVGVGETVSALGLALAPTPAFGIVLGDAAGAS